ncbi:hypothetical protein FRC03_001507 [Tulasnella sp. 419]|nr:hypothetical protein FRC03_001507 [Tulasnella sp. 419]
MIPQITEKYKMYITRHPATLAQFQSLPQSPALTAYLTDTKALASIRTNEWDIPSLLMKPIQRLLLYPLRIGEIISYTPDDHPDKVHLVEAKALIEEIPKAFNEGRKRWEVMKATLTPNSGDGKDVKDRRSGGSNRLSQLRTKVGRMRSFASLNTSSVVDSDLGKEKDEIEEWEKRLKDCEGACKGLAKGSLQLCNDLQFCFKRLKAWATCFERVIGLNEYPLDAVTAFDKVVSGLQTLWVELDNTLLTVLLPQLSKLITSLSSPQTLLAHLHTLYHSHIILLDTPQNKLRSANAILEASQDFLTLIAILRRELPSFFLMFENGLGLILVEFSRWQSRLYQEAKDRWMQFWIALNVADGESKPEEAIYDLKVGAEKTIEIWRDRFSEVEELLMSFKIMPHLPLNPLQHQVLLHGSTPPHKLAPITSGIGMYGQEGAFASKSPHGSQPPFNDFKKLHGTPTLRSKYSPPTAPGVPVYMRNASGEIDPLRAKDISLISIVHNNNMPQTKPSRREKLRDSGKESEREQERERKNGIKKEWIAEEQEQRREAKGLLKEERERSALQAVKARLSTLLPSLKERTKTQSSVFRNKVSPQAATMMLSDNSPENTLESTPEVELRELNLGNKTLCGIKIGCGGYSDIFEGTLMFHRDQMKVAIKALRVQGHTGTREADNDCESISIGRFYCGGNYDTRMWCHC